MNVLTEIREAEVVEWCRTYSGPRFHAVMTDPPYHLESGNVILDQPVCVTCGRVLGGRDGVNQLCPRCGGKTARSRRRGTNGAGGFMGQEWDSGDVAFRPETWEAIASVCHPGAFGMSFASSRGWHRVAVAIEDAGLIIHPSIFGWAFGNGFPKSVSIARAIDKAAGVDGAVRGPGGKKKGPNRTYNSTLGNQAADYEYVPLTDGAKRWAGHRYGIQCIKPALEPIIVWQVPYRGRPLDSIQSTGAGALNIDAARIPVDGARPYRVATGDGAPGVVYGPGAKKGSMSVGVTDAGRWPSGLVLDAGAAAALDEQAGPRRDSGISKLPGSTAEMWDEGVTTSPGQESPSRTGPGEGGPSRFFHVYQEDALAAADPLCYYPKASRGEREAGLTHRVPRRSDFRPDEPETGYADNALSARLHHSNKRLNTHPTIKPIALAQHLATLLLPPADFAPRRLFVPFAGAASECIGAMRAGWEEVVGIERKHEYVSIGLARIAYWSGALVNYAELAERFLDGDGDGDGDDEGAGVDADADAGAEERLT